MLISVLLQSEQKLVTPEEARTMTRAVAEQVKLHAAPIWDKAPAAVVFYSDPSEVPAGAHGISIVDTIDNVPQGVLGFHTEDDGGKLWGIVAAKPPLDAGGQVLTGDWSVSSVLSHEVLEMFVDPNCNLWANNENGRAYSYEVCDPVEAPTYEVDGVSVSNFLTPAWFDPLADTKGTQYDYLGHLKKPFTLLPGGYLVYESAGKEHQENGDKMPEWRLSAKSTDMGRTNRRRRQLGA
jgi:hypothetical protein